LNTKKIVALTQEYQALEDKQQGILREIQSALHEKERKKVATPKKKLKGMKTKNTPGGRSTKQRARTRKNTPTSTTTSAGVMGEGNSTI